MLAVLVTAKRCLEKPSRQRATQKLAAALAIARKGMHTIQLTDRN